jgi:molybdopterin-containing oxidoreductase family membrane subunit
MEDFIPLYNYVTDALFFGFGFFTVLILLPYYYYGNELKPLVSDLLESVCKLIRVVALIYFILAMVYVVQQALKDDGFLNKENFFGNGSAFFWVKLIGVPLILQFFWFSTVYKNKWILFFIALLTGFFFLILNQRFIIMITSVHRDYLPDSWDTHANTLLLYYLRYLGQQLLIFTGIIVPFHAFRLYRK